MGYGRLETSGFNMRPVGMLTRRPLVDKLQRDSCGVNSRILTRCPTLNITRSTECVTVILGTAAVRWSPRSQRFRCIAEIILLSSNCEGMLCDTWRLHAQVYRWNSSSYILVPVSNPRQFRSLRVAPVPPDLRPLSRCLDRCDRMIQNGSSYSNGGIVRFL